MLEKARGDKDSYEVTILAEIFIKLNIIHPEDMNDFVLYFPPHLRKDGPSFYLRDISEHSESTSILLHSSDS